MIQIAIPGRAVLCLEHALLDVNGTLSDRGALLDGVDQRLARLRSSLQIHLVSADTFGTLEQIATRLQARALRAADGKEKLAELQRLGPGRCAVVGNGANDALVLEACALGVAVLGPEGASPRALGAADVVCRSVLDALDLLLDPRALTATLRP